MQWVPDPVPELLDPPALPEPLDPPGGGEPEPTVCMTENVAVMVVSAFIVMVQVAVPEHPPPVQPAKTEPGAGLAVSVTEVPKA
jgi:hypothetical protein